MTSRIQVSRGALARELDGAVLVLDSRTSLYFGMTGMAARIWQLVEAGATRDTSGNAGGGVADRVYTPLSAIDAAARPVFVTLA